MAISSGRLFVCATPIGNLEDITLRALRILKEADVIAAEDTRVTRKLLSYYKIRNHLVSYYRHNEAQRLPELIERLKQGQNVALVSDAGMPGISDPGAMIVRHAIYNGIPVEVVPGASALVSALVVSGFDTDCFSFHGFLPRKQVDRTKTLRHLSNATETLIFYEAPHRIEKTLRDLSTEMRGRRIALVREITKRFEEVRRGTVEEVIESVEKKPVKGEIVLIVEGAAEIKRTVTDETIVSMLRRLSTAGVAKKEAVRKVADDSEAGKRRVYELAEKAWPKKKPSS